MSEAFVIDREFLFKSDIFEITSISIEQNSNIDGSCLHGDFIISGDYKLHEVSINKDDFSFKIPFSHEIKANINLDTVELEITYFSYEFVNGDEVKVHVEYIINGEQEIIEFDDEKSLDEFLESTKAEVVDFSIREETQKEEEVINDDEEERKEDDFIREDNEEIKEERKEIDENTIVNSINSEESYVKYNVHVVTTNDSIESILLKYNISLIELKKYNSFDNLELNMKLIIPDNEEN